MAVGLDLNGGLVLAFGFLRLGFQVLGLFLLRLLYRSGGLGIGLRGAGCLGFTCQAFGFLLATANFTRVVGGAAAGRAR